MTTLATLVRNAASAFGAKASRGSRQASASPESPRLLIGYGAPMLWHTVEPDQLADSLHNAGCTFTAMEYGSLDGHTPRPIRPREARAQAARRFVDAMRSKGITTMISLVNWTVRSNREQDDAWFRSRLREVTTQVGTDGVILLGVASPDRREDGKAYRWAQHAAEQWRGLKAASGEGGRAEPTSGGFHYVYWRHDIPEEDLAVRTDTLGKPTVNVIECGRAAGITAERIRAAALTALRRGAHVLAYGAGDDRTNDELIGALGTAIEWSTSESHGLRSAGLTGRPLPGRPQGSRAVLMPRS